MNMSTNMALKTRTRCYSFDQSVRKCDGSIVVNMMNKNYIIFPDRVISTAVLLLLCVKHHAHRNSKSRVYSEPPTRSYTAAAGGVADRCCCCCGLGARTNTRTVPLTSGWRVYIPDPDIYRLAVTERSCLLYTSPSPRDRQKSRMPSSA